MEQTKKNFLNISRAECRLVYKNVLASSDKRWKLVKQLSSEEDFGMAISVSIISIEELVKAIILFLDGNGFDFRKIKGMNSFFKNHEIRFVVAYIMFVIILLGDELKALFIKIKDNPNKISQIEKELQNESVFFERKKIYFFRKLITLKRELLWFSKVEIFRQEGFYSDYNGILKSPIETTPHEFWEVYRRLKRVRTFGLEFIKYVETSEESVVKQITQIKKDLKSKGVYKKIELGLLFLKKEKQRPFYFLINSLNNILKE